MASYTQTANTREKTQNIVSRLLIRPRTHNWARAAAGRWVKTDCDSTAALFKIYWRNTPYPYDPGKPDLAEMVMSQQQDLTWPPNR